MNQLYEYMNPKDRTVVVPVYSLKSAPLQLKGKVFDLVDQFIDGEGKDIVIKAFGDWYKDNSKRRNIKADVPVSVSLFLGDPDNKLLTEVIGEIVRIGVHGEGGEFDFYDPSKPYQHGKYAGGATIKFAAATYKQFQEGNYKYEKSFGDCSVNFVQSRYGNGYNDLPTTDINVLRQKLYDCIDDTTCEIIAVPYGRFSGIPQLPKFNIILRAVYDKKKLKELLTELKNDRRLQNFADRMDATSRGIQAYYASKRPGEYVGD